jgi:hypothetical protein
MNKLIPLMALALLILVGCAKEETTPIVADDQQVDETSFYAFYYEGDNPVWERMTFDEQSDNNTSLDDGGARDNNGNSGHMHGSFNSVEFSATENNGGTHGGATLSLGPWTFSSDTECVMVDDNEAVYGGLVTERTGPPSGPPIGPGWHVYFKVIDNGQGNNDPADQFFTAISFTPPPASQCGIWTPGSAKWNELPPFFLYLDIPEPGSVKVNN